LKTVSFILIILLLSSHSFASVPSVKVLIGKSLKKVVVEGIDLQKTFHLKNELKQYRGKKIISFNCKPHTPVKRLIRKNPLLVASLSSPTGLVSWGAQKYQGELQLLTNSSRESCDLVNSIPLESYIMTLLSKEMNGSWPVEALKAQAVAARTYAFDRIKKERGLTLDKEKLYHLESSEKDQVSGSFSDITRLTIKASKETEGEILIAPSGKIAPAFFHSKCGGKTLRPDQVWGGVEEGYRSVNCTFCAKTGTKDWNYRTKNQKIISMVDKVLQKYYSDEMKSNEIRFMPDTLENSELRLYAGDRLHIIKKSYLRNLAGRELLPSNNFILHQSDNIIEFKGHGYGHGVGLCQLGAYFPRHRMKKVY